MWYIWSANHTVIRVVNTTQCHMINQFWCGMHTLFLHTTPKLVYHMTLHSVYLTILIFYCVM